MIQIQKPARPQIQKPFGNDTVAQAPRPSDDPSPADVYSDGSSSKRPCLWFASQTDEVKSDGSSSGSKGPCFWFASQTDEVKSDGSARGSGCLVFASGTEEDWLVSR